MVYLLHFSRPFSHARHYCGSARDTRARLRRHHLGYGANLTAHAVAAGIHFVIAREWPGGREEERMIKLRNDLPRLCPLCNPRALRRAVTVPAVRRSVCEQ